MLCSHSQGCRRKISFSIFWLVWEFPQLVLQAELFSGLVSANCCTIGQKCGVGVAIAETLSFLLALDDSVEQLVEVVKQDIDL